MTIETAYLKFIQKVNKNFTNDNISVDYARFIYLFNESQNKYVEWTLDKRNAEDIRYIQILLVDDLPLEKEGSHNSHDDFKLPDNFFDASSVEVFASSGNCGNAKMFSIEIKDENRDFHLVDSATKPSFLYRETFYIYSDGKIKIFKDNFSVDRVTMSYYRYPKQVDIKGYIKEDGSQSTSIDPEFDDKVVDRIISIAAKDFDGNNDGEKYNLANARVANSF